MATMVLTVVGTALGGPIGAAIGATLGQVIDSQILFAPKARQGPRLADLRLQTSRYGDQIPRLYGTMRVAGSVIWATDLVERRQRQSAGKGQPKVTTYSYSASFAVAFSSRAVLAVRRIWADGNLLRGAAGDFKTALGAFRLHRGGEDQPLDPLIAAHKGMASTPAHRGLAYAVFEDLQLADFGNRIPSLTFEVVADEGAVSIAAIGHDLSGGAILAQEDEALPMVSGYAAGGGSIADALAPLTEGMDAALVADAAGLALTQGRDGGEVLAAGLAGAVFNGKAERGVKQSRGRVEDVPVRLVVHHYDPARDYQTGAQRAERPGAGRLERSVDLPAALDAGAARALAERRLQRLWIERSAMEMRCDWRALRFAPGAVLSVEGQPGRWRLEQSEWEAMGVRLRLKRVDGGAVADPPAEAGAPVVQVDGLHGPTHLLLADLPPPTDEVLAAPLVVAAAAGEEAGWRMAELFVEEEASGGLTPLGTTAPPATMGVVAVPPVGAVSPWLFDDRSAVEVELLRADMMLAGAEDAALLEGANRALLGQEAIQFGRADRIGETRWRLTHLLRGRRGTEWAIGAQQAGDPFLLLDQESLFAIPVDQLRIGADLVIDAIGVGDGMPVQARRLVTGQAILPLAPVHAQAVQSGGAWRIDWTRRSRNGWRWNDGVDAPLVEERELYRIQLVQGGTLIRAAESGEARWIYDADAIAADRARGFSGAVIAEIRQIGTHGVGRAASVGLSI